VTIGQRRRLPSFCWYQYTPACLIFRVYRKPILKLACGCTRLLSYFPSPATGVECLLMEGHSSAISRARDR
jgi:hypothetical protein